MEQKIKKNLPAQLGKIFRNLSGKGSENLHIKVLGDALTVEVKGYITDGLLRGEFLNDPLMKSATQTYYTKMIQNSILDINSVLQDTVSSNAEFLLCDFEVEKNLGMIFYILNGFEKKNIIEKEIETERIRKEISYIFGRNTGGVPSKIELFFSEDSLGGTLLIKAKDFLGRFTETQFMNDEEMVHANEVFYCRMLKNEFLQIPDSFRYKGHQFRRAYCAVNIYHDCAVICLKEN